LKEATQRARESERAVFQNLECLTSPETAQDKLRLTVASVFQKELGPSERPCPQQR
jgi:hypothetical protein